MEKAQIPFNKAVQLPNHPKYALQAISLDKISSGGVFSKKCELELKNHTGSPNILVPSATAALEMMALLLDLNPGDEVILPSFTFVSTASAFALRNVNIQFADNDEFGNILPSEIDRLANRKTKAACIVHYGGNSAPMNEMSEVCKQKNITLLEDAAQCIDSKYLGKPLGTFGSLGCYSFHDTKNITSGEGGSLIINDPSQFEKAEIIRDKGTNRSAFNKGLVSKYSWIALGSSYCLSELNAAYLLPQLIDLNVIQSKRKMIWMRYKESLNEYLLNNGIKLIEAPHYNTANYHMFAVLTQSSKQRDLIIDRLSDLGVQAAFHYLPLHLSPFGKQYNNGPLINCENFSANILRLPLWFNMSNDEIDHVISATYDTLKSL